MKHTKKIVQVRYTNLNRNFYHVFYHPVYRSSLLIIIKIKTDLYKIQNKLQNRLKINNYYNIFFKKCKIQFQTCKKLLK